MDVTVGDRVIVRGTRPGAARRDGEIVALHHPDGTPPYDVRWSENGRVTTFFPGPDTEIHHYPAADRHAVRREQRHLFAD